MKYFASINILFLLIFNSGLESNAQQTKRFGLSTGLNISKMKMSGPSVKENYNKAHAGFQLGFTGELFVSKSFALETGLGLSNKGYNYEGPINFAYVTYNGTFKTNLLYLDIPMVLKAYIPLGSNKFYVLAGPYIGLGLSGKHKLSVTNSRGSTLEDKLSVEWGESDNGSGEYKRLDFGWNLGVGLDFGTIQLGVTHSFGTTNIDLTSQETSKNQNTAITLSYKFID